MVKKIRLDFSKVEERSGWNTKRMPEGLHEFKIVSVEDKEAQDGTDMWVFALVPTSDKFKTRRFPFYCKLQQNQLWKLRDLFVAAGIAVPKRAQQIDPTKVVGKVIAAEVSDETGQYEGRSTIDGVYGIDVLEDLDDNEVEDDEDEYDEEEADEAEDEEYEDDEDDELEEDEDDDLDDDLEDDEDDEDLYEEDDEEEEEPAPAPKRRTPAKPAAKAAPVKRTAAAPTKRVVKRR